MGGRNWEIGIDAYTLLTLCIKETTNENLLRSSGSSTQCSDDLNGKEIQKRGYICMHGLPRWLSGKESTCNVGDAGLIPGLGTFPGEGNNNPLQYSCLENSVERGVWWATFHGAAKRHS